VVAVVAVVVMTLTVVPRTWLHRGEHEPEGR